MIMAPPKITKNHSFFTPDTKNRIAILAIIMIGIPVSGCKIINPKGMMRILRSLNASERSEREFCFFKIMLINNQGCFDDQDNLHKFSGLK